MTAISLLRQITELLSIQTFLLLALFLGECIILLVILKRGL